jgi:Cu/Ag efflux pump CusA
MTSFAFILGTATGDRNGTGSAGRNSVGTAVVGGMLASTFLSTVFIRPAWAIRRSRRRGTRSQRDDDVRSGVAHA